MALLYMSLFLLLWSIAIEGRSKLNNVVYVLLFLFIVFAKVFVDINALPDLDHYFNGYRELSRVNWWKVPSYDLTFLKCPEIGFRYILRIGSWFGDFKWSLFIIAVVNTFAYIHIAKKYSPYVMISLVIFLLGSVQSFFVLRQHLAIAVTILSYPYIINRDWKKFLLLMFLAFSFHQTALAFIPVYYLYGIKDNKKLIAFLLVASAVLALSFAFIFNYFASSLIGYEGYIDSNESNMTTLMISACYLFTYVFFVREKVFAEGANRLVFILLALNFIIMLVGYTFSGINRLMMYYTVVTILSVPLTMKYIKQPVTRNVFCAVVLLILVYIFCNGSNAEYLKAINV